MLTHEDINYAISYDSKTGVMKWKNGVNIRYIGNDAGSINKAGYVDIAYKGWRLYGHRVAWLLVYKEWPSNHVDHINGNRSDNRIENLRVATNQENSKNSKRHKGNTSGVTGVYWSKRANKWQAYICVDGKQTYLGVFKYLEDAERARKDAEVKYGFHKNHGRVEKLGSNLE
jgi:hypothetical protein